MRNAEKMENSSPSPQQKKKSIWRPIILGIILISFLALAKVFNLGGRLGELREWILSLGAFGPLVYILIYIVAVVFAIPGSVITVMGGVLFGSVVGVASVSVGSTIGASLAFLVSRHFARDAIAQKFAKNKKFHHLDQLTKKHGAIIVAITRLVPLFPFNLLNYGFGLTHVSSRHDPVCGWCGCGCHGNIRKTDSLAFNHNSCGDRSHHHHPCQAGKKKIKN